ncbi:uncharacterized protein LOC134766365 [Penaeus indicus]|uniref:uncharacterized protein LOC134766365 n=1 Tax=Penaeus indicus TaxID=29960 RepID=UPI00300CA9ED
MNSRLQLIWLMLAVGAIASSSALRCLHCSNCMKTADTYHDCDDSYDVCMKINVAGRVEKRCGYSWACGLGGLERGAVSMWNAIKNSVSESDQQASDAQLIYCCDRDYCNAAAPASLSSALVLAGALLAYALA